VRYQAYNCRVIASQRHEMMLLADNHSREIVARLDGTRTPEQIVEELLPMMDPEQRESLDDPRATLTTSVGLVLERMARSGVLLPDDAEDH